MTRTLLLPGLAGIYKNWNYFQVIIKVKDLVDNFGTELSPNYRVKTTDEVEEIYSRNGIGQLLQRALDKGRIEPIKRFIIEQPDSYVNNLTVAIFGGSPEWIPFDVSENSFAGLAGSDFVSPEELIKTFGVVKLNGDETLFVLDGQHRLKGLRAAIEDDPFLGENDISLTLITHNDSNEGREKTRRLFSIINRHAKPVSLGENILLDEDDMSAIITRNLVENYSRFSSRNLIALNKTADLKLPRDKTKFSTAICLWTINEMLIDAKKVYPKFEGPIKNLVRIRPSDEVIENYSEIVINFWDTFFSLLPIADQFVRNPIESPRGEVGPFSLRPIGQQLFCDFYLKLKNINRLDQLVRISNVPDDLSNNFWHYVLYNPSRETMLRNRSYARDYLFYMLGISISTSHKNRLEENYKKYTQDENSVLPTPIF